jgi:hypothetical protein
VCCSPTDTVGSDCEQCEQKFTAVSHFIHTVKKLPFYCTQRDVGTESDCGVDGSVLTVAINFHSIMDPIIVIVALIIITVEIYIRLL